jgi:hypothetical protein
LTPKVFANCLSCTELHRPHHWIAPGIRVLSSIYMLCMLFPPRLVSSELPLYVFPNGSRSTYQLSLAQLPTSSASIVCLLARLRIETVQCRGISTPLFLFHPLTVCCACCQCLERPGRCCRVLTCARKVLRVRPCVVFGLSGIAVITFFLLNLAHETRT